MRGYQGYSWLRCRSYWGFVNIDKKGCQGYYDYIFPIVSFVMKYLLLITKKENEEKYLVTVPDLPGCQTLAESMNEGIENINHVISEHLNILTEYGEDIPHGKSIDHHMKNCHAVSPIWAIVDFDILPYLGKSHKINVTLPELLIKKIDDRVGKSPAYKTRSGFIAASCLAELSKKNTS